MSTPPAPIPRDSEDATTISDQMMVFRSNQASSPSKMEKKVVLKNVKERLKARKSTPAPPIKGNGRKRLDLSPCPEDKQLRKKIDFGIDTSPTMEAPKCKGSIFPVETPLEDDDEDSNKDEQMAGSLINEATEMKLVSSSPSTLDEAPPDSGTAAGGEVVAGPDVVNLLSHSRSKLDEATNAKGILVGERVNLPKVNLETTPLLESCLVSSHFEGSHDALAVGFPMQPKHDNFLHLASFDSAEMLDNFEAQPLLAGSLPDSGQLAAGAYATHLPPPETAMSRNSHHLRKGEL